MDVYGAPPAGLDGDYYGGHPFGVLAEDLAADGLNGPGYLFGCVTLPADAGKRVRGPITRWPAASLTVYPDGAFDYPPTAANDYALFLLVVDGQAGATDIGYGPGIGRFNFNIGEGLSGDVQLGGVEIAGELGGGNASQLGGAVQLDAVQAAGALGAQGVSELGGGVPLEPVGPGGLMVGTQPVSAPPARRRLQTSTRGPRGGRRGSR